MSDSELELVSGLPGPPILVQIGSDELLVRRFLGLYTRSENTRTAYTADVQAFTHFIGQTPLKSVTMGDVQDFAASIVGAPATVARRLSAVKSLIKLGHRLGYLAFDTAAPIRLPAIKDTLAERILDESAVQRLLWSARPGRNATLLRLIYGAGLRVSEACALRWRDLVSRDDAGQLTVFGKGGKTRIILLPGGLWRRVEALRGPAGDDDPVFLSRNTGPLRRRQVHEIVKVTCRRAGLSPKISTHWLRHCHASHALDRGAPIHLTQATLGHASVATTGRYLHARPGDSSARYLPD